jgi:hypothetical protein
MKRTLTAAVAVWLLTAGVARAELLHYWDFNEGTGTTANDQGQASTLLNLTLGGNAQHAPDAARGTVLSLDGSSTTYAFSTKGVPFTAPITHTVSLWGKHDTHGMQRYLSWGRYFFGIYPEAQRPSETDGITSLCFGASQKAFFTNSYYDDTSPIVGTPLVDTAWHYWTLVAQQDGTNNRVSLYRDAELLQTIALTGATIDTSSYKTFYIGAQFNGGELFDGLIDDVAIWDTALTPEQIAIAMDAGPLALPEPSTSLLSLGALLGVLGLHWCRRGK